ncbi:PREDICTED: piggyBac transposable element-derived protein 3-like [Cyphomyrmex costatus]|uniref:piggyBac transposable element-derived protein 3-like n=1 Tax=Cyphomyrmex costatus TaxID=456900 RepID=UPI000852350D|nr:PREDICTED: piggyBac transposable element-derived protein 3-like [Cyphomyrmex costatus]
MHRRKPSNIEGTQNDISEGNRRELFENDDCIDVAIIPDASNSDVDDAYDDSDGDSESEIVDIDESIKAGLKCARKADENAKDPAWRVRTIFEMFKSNVKRYGYFQTALSVDEMMVKFKGRLRFRQYIRNKPVRFGIKMWALCGSDGYLYECDIYCGKYLKSDGNLSNCSLGSRVVINMTEKFLLSTSRKKVEQYHLYFDNYFTSPDLIIHLHKIGLKATGTVRQNRVKENNKLGNNVPRGTIKVKHEKNSGLNYITVMDSKEVSLLSTAAGVNPLRMMRRYSQEKRSKDDIAMPNAFANYNKHMGGVDTHDQYCSTLLPIFRSKKWTWVVLMRLIQSSISNAVILFNTVQESGKKASAKDFAMHIARTYLQTKVVSALKAHKMQNEKKRKHCSGTRFTLITVLEAPF